FGCQMNIADSDRFSRILDELGFEKVQTPETSDLVIVNTCVVRAKAEDKAFSYLGALEKIKKKGKDIRVVLAGCLSPLSDELALKKRFPSILFSIDPKDIDDFKNQINRHLCRGLPVCRKSEQLSGEIVDTDLHDTIDLPFHAFVNVMRGCEQYCSYCIVPMTRGENNSLKFDDIKDEIKWRIKNGAKSITLLGQSILDYGKDWDKEKRVRSIKGDKLFRDLLDRISAHFPDIWIKFLTSHPKDFSFETVDLIASRPNISRFIHIPVQSGDDGVLKKMNRGHDREYYFKLTNYIYEKIPDVRLSSDIIVGFPTEDKAAFEQSIDLLEKVRFTKVFTFQYSTRSKTPASKLSDDSTPEEKRNRLNQLIDIQNRITMERHKELEGHNLAVMVEGRAQKTDSLLMGRTLGEDVVIFESNIKTKPGDIITVRIIEGRLRTLIGEIIK
ncbi:MAG: tRNA (N6-isopentenyl adenosine(37)-C2)-methylthiotransferase MiaB, partial [bacterium]